MTKTLIVVSGPTSAGKTEFSIHLAKQFDTEILSADSRQFYREMNIGTGKPTDDELRKVKHYFIGHISIHETYSAGKFEVDALKQLEILFSSHDVAILCGGSGMYINAVIQGMDDIPFNEESRKKVNAILESEGIDGLRDKLRQADPDYFSIVDTGNQRRLSRALEVSISNGLPYSSFLLHKQKNRDFKIVKIGITMPREKLYDKINRRVEKMMDEGFLEEAKKLISYKHLNALQTVGYKELFDFIEGKYGLQDAVRLIKQRTRNYAKRQMTWFNKDKEIVWILPGEYEKVIEMMDGY